MNLSRIKSQNDLLNCILTPRLWLWLAAAFFIAFTLLSSFWTWEECRTYVPWLRQIPQNTSFKTRHILQYGGMSIFLFLAIKNSFSLSTRSVSMLALSISTLVGGFSEFTQSFIPGRIPSVADVGFDLLGAFIGLASFLCIKKLTLLLIDKYSNKYDSP